LIGVAPGDFGVVSARIRGADRADQLTDDDEAERSEWRSTRTRVREHFATDAFAVDVSNTDP